MRDAPPGMDQAADEAKKEDEARKRMGDRVSGKSVRLESYAEQIFQMLDDDESGQVSKTEVLDFCEKMGPSREEMGKEVDWDGNGLAYPHRTGFRPVSDQCHVGCTVHVTVNCLDINS